MKNITIEVVVRLLSLMLRSNCKKICILNFNFSFLSEGFEDRTGININREIIGFTKYLGGGYAISIWFDVPIFYRKYKPRPE